MATDERLRREINALGRQFGNVIREFEGEDAYNLVEEVRHFARTLTDGDGEHRDLDALLAGLSIDQLRVVTRAFSTFLEIANLAEDRQRVRALRTWEQEAHPAPRKESMRAAIQQLAAAGFTHAQIIDALAKIDVELVFTAHPTEAKRRSLRSRLREIRNLLGRLDSTRLLPREQQELEHLVQREIAKLWQTDSIRPERPTVLHEVQRGLSFQPVLWDTIPRILSELRDSLDESYPGAGDEVPPLVQFGSWMGGDRDGHPHVTAPITRQTCLWLRQAALEAHLAQCNQLSESLSQADHQHPGAEPLRQCIRAALDKWPDAAEALASFASDETYRRWLGVIRWRLEATLAADPDAPASEAEYPAPQALITDVRALHDALLATGNRDSAMTEVRRWLDQLVVFGFRTARLDIRQHSEIYQSVMEEIWTAVGVLAPGTQLDEHARLALLAQTLPIAANLAPVQLSEDAQKTLDLFTVLRRLARRFGMQMLGGHVISMTRAASDLLTVLWLWRWSERTDGGDSRDAGLRLPIIPLFESINDLEHAREILATALQTPDYRAHVDALGNEQTVMIGYSDSTKDGGYLTAAWALQSSQVALFRLAKQYGVAITFFHGRGGSLGRGGGPAARAILSLPRETFHGSLRLTEQGEVLAERYDDPAVAHRHLEQLLWSTLMATTQPAEPRPDKWIAAMDQASAKAFETYRALVEHPSFVDFFRTATPISEIEQLPIGSRPSRRGGGHRIQDLRAIPWVFAWTQSRCLLPAWYGLGSGLEAVLAGDKAAEMLQAMYASWPFFRATIDNSVLAVAKSNMSVFRRYVALAPDDAGLHEVADKLFAEHARAERTLAIITGGTKLLDNIEWLQRSIVVRNRYVDPLNLIQVELLRREKNANDADREPLRQLAQLVIKGIAAGMRTTG